MPRNHPYTVRLDRPAGVRPSSAHRNTSPALCPPCHWLLAAKSSVAPGRSDFMGTRGGAQPRHCARKQPHSARTARSTPITEFAHKAAVVGDALVRRSPRRLRHGRRVPPYGSLDRRHDLELGQAQVAGVGGTPGGPLSTEDIGDLERRCASRVSRRDSRPASATPDARADSSPARIVLVATRA